ncbi:MAG: acetyl-CoA acetyltransferase [bacterium]
MRRRRVAIVGAGCTQLRAVTPELSYRELTHEAAVAAYADAGVVPSEIESFISTAEDFMEGYSIADEYSPDQIGAVLKPTQTISGDALHSLSVGVMEIMTGRFDLVAVQAMSKASNVATMGDVANFALDPVLNRQLGNTAHFVAGLEMARYMYETGTTRGHCAAVVVKNRRNALRNPLAGFGCDLTVEQVLDSEPVSHPLHRLDISPQADGAAVFVLASAEAAKGLKGTPVWVEGVGWCTESASLESRSWGDSPATALAAKAAYETAGIKTPAKEIHFVELNDEYSYKELQHLEALGLCPRGAARNFIEGGLTERGGALPVNVSGGALGCGHLFEASGAHKLYEAVLQLRGCAGERQVKGAEVGLVHAWRGVPTTSCAVAVLSNRT